MSVKGNAVIVGLKSRLNYRESIKAKVLFFDYDAKIYDF
jgi:hypothetical protein